MQFCVYWYVQYVYCIHAYCVIESITHTVYRIFVRHQKLNCQIVQNISR